MLKRMGSSRPTQIHLEQSTTDAFFQRGREMAQAADSSAKIKPRRLISFEDPSIMAALLTPRRTALFVDVRDRAGTIAEVANRLGRSARAVNRDVEFFAQLGIFVVEPAADGLAGIYRRVRADADKLVLSCVIGE
ncbi:MAG: hypothetical protein JNN20_06835 [Betaproteobacteria bacterium]|nr:hypothetical protein [Betaproteobacteria bacterium]